eukprot:6116085-Alexandrium_andersonii.AAC.1
MSASLVGSEMCIRDSYCVAWVTLALWLVAPWSSLGLIRRALSRGLLSVSYTHLTLPTICSV